MRLSWIVRVLPIGAALRLIGAVRRIRPASMPEPQPVEPFSPPFIAEEDFEQGDLLVPLGDSLFRSTGGTQMPPAFRARRAIRRGEQVFNDPTDPVRSDLDVIVPPNK